jgi:hypothetical protein
MKTYVKLILGTFFVLTSCDNEVLEVASSTQISSETFWKTEADVRLAVNGEYSSLADLEGNYIYYDVLSDNAYGNYPWEGYKAIADGTHSPRSGGAIDWVWNGCFQGIGRANVVLDNYEKVGNLSDAFKKSVRGESLFLRAYFYFRLTEFYGGVPIILESPKLVHAEIPRDTKENVVTQILKDLDEAATLLPSTQSETGKATKGAVKALKARVLLYNQKWSEAAATAQEVMSMGYSLFPNYRDLFREANENNNEVIFDVQYKSPEKGNYFGLYLASYTIGGWSSIVPLKNLVDDYEMTDGKSISQSPLYNASTPYNNRDPRLKQTISVPGATINGIANHETEFTGFMFKKYTEYDETGVFGAPSDAVAAGINAIIFRYAEILLTYAEAKNEVSGPDQSVYDAINLVRTRLTVNMPPVTPGLTKDQMRQVIRHERRIELALEGTRYSDLRRWDIAETTLDGLADPGGIRVFDASKDYLWPIPGGEFDIAGTKLVQNPGYGN